MQIIPNESSESGYQPQPPAPPSAGRALSVLIAVCAVLWVWLMLPEWYLSGYLDSEAANWLRDTLYNIWTVSVVVIVSNLVMWRWCTQPMWRNLVASGKSNVVLGLALLFHMAFAFVLVSVALLLLSSVKSDGPFLGY